MKSQSENQGESLNVNINNNLLYSENRGNTVVSESSKPIENIEVFKGKRYRVSVSFSEKPDESAQHDVLTMLMNLRWKE